MPYQPALYMHPLDQKATTVLNAMPGFTDLIWAFKQGFNEKKEKYRMLSSAIRLGEDQKPATYALLPPICAQLGIPVPDFYMVHSKRMEAATTGNKEPLIYISSALAEALNAEQLTAVLAHECGHLACRHLQCHTIANLLLEGVERGVEASPLGNNPSIRRFLSPALIRALLYWYRCSELSADRAAVLVSGSADPLIDGLLQVHGYGKDINRQAFLDQAKDLQDFIKASKTNKLAETAITQDETHPRLAARAYEADKWAHSPQCQSILSGTYTVEQKQREEDCTETEQKEVVSAEIALSAESAATEQATPPSQTDQQLADLNQKLADVDKQLERYTNQADKLDYAMAVGSGLIAGLVDSFFVGEFSLEKANEWGDEKMNALVRKVGKMQGYPEEDLPAIIRHLEEDFPIAADKATNDFGGGLQHHLRDFSHHPTPVGLVCSILTQFTGKVYGADVNGNFKSVPLHLEGADKALIGKSFPEKIALGTAQWVFHLASDMAGSSSSVSKGRLGTGIPGPLVSLLKELSATPLFRNLDKDGHKTFSVWISKLFNGTLLGERDANGKLIAPCKFDLRTELGIGRLIAQQTIPVLLNECIVRVFYFLRRLTDELRRVSLSSVRDLAKLDWNKIAPFRNRTIERMLTISSLTFSVADTTDAAVRAAVECGGNWVLFSGKFVSRINVVGVGRAAVAVVREVSSDKVEAQLLQERLILQEEHAILTVQQLQAYKDGLEERVSNYLAEDITAFLEGFDLMKEGIRSGDSNLVIRGNVTIQKVLGRTPQFTSQEEFDDLTESDIALKL